MRQNISVPIETNEIRLNAWFADKECRSLKEQARFFMRLGMSTRIKELGTTENAIIHEMDEKFVKPGEDA